MFITKYEKTVVLGIILLILLAICPSMIDISAEVQALLFVSIIVIVLIVFEIHSYRTMVSDKTNPKKARITINIHEDSKKDTVYMSVDGKLINKFSGRIIDYKFNCPRGKHCFTFQRKNIISSIDVDVSNDLILSVYCDDRIVSVTEHRRSVEHLQKIQEISNKESSNDLLKWVVVSLVAFLFIALTIFRILMIYNII